MIHESMQENVKDDFYMGSKNYQTFFICIALFYYATSNELIENPVLEPSRISMIKILHLIVIYYYA